MNLRKNLFCCATSPVCHLLVILLGSFAMIQLVHTHAHYKMDVDVDSYVTAFCKKNAEKCRRLID